MFSTIFAPITKPQQNMKKYICYYRVSTRKQSLGLEAQRTTCRNYINTFGGCLVNEYQEKETGKDTGVHYANRPQLLAALEECKKEGAALLVAKADRLTRDLEDGAHLCKNHTIEFCDHPDMKDPIMQGLFFGLAMQERQYISERIKSALQELKAKGKRLGTPKDKETLRKMAARSLEVRRGAARAHRANKMAWAVVEAMGNCSATSIAKHLNQAGFKTIRGRQWTGLAVRNLCALMNGQP